MKHLKIATLALLSMLLGSCEKDVLETSGNEELLVTSESSLSQKNSTVTTLAALKSAVSSAVAGDVITISGTIKLDGTLTLSKNGTSSSKITFQGGVIDCSGVPGTGRGVALTGSYWIVRDMTIKNAPDNGLILQNGGFNTVSNVKTLTNKDTGLQIANGSHDNLITGCYSANNNDTANGGENADGFACKQTGGKNNKFEGCTAESNSDDGWDLYEQPYTVIINKCIAKTNGKGANGDGNGFKLGSAGQKIPHTVTNCTATNNKKNGYDGNGNTGKITITGSGGSGNGQSLFSRIF
ncbi:right-handed parallel beta-helix repeat-containing protein [Flavobacterium polysaccharolyticum]|uniref:Right-handed parallel beta-helix repeat-containing protein n=1 Tax=Flavobacterium polysaccharolyticum TaxID=3133148 RepID=A0ABU9NVT5_9FLAO